MIHVRDFKIFALLLTSILCGCASAPLPEATALRPAPKRATIEVKEAIFWRTEGIPIDAGVTPCTFVAERENDLGTFYRGERRCLFMLIQEHRDSFVMRKPQLIFHDGGLWVPKAGGPARTYGFFDPDAMSRIQTLEPGPKDPHVLFPAVAVQAEAGPSAADRATADIVGRQVNVATPAASVGAAAAGGAIAGTLVSAMIEADRGRITLGAAPKGSVAEAKFQEIADRQREKAAAADAH